MGKKLYIVTKDCCGCGMCETTCPDIFKVVDGVSTIIKSKVEKSKLLKIAEGHCLNFCIQWEAE